MILPVAEQAAEEIWPAQNRAVRRRGSADNYMVAAAGADVPAVDHELLGAEPRQAGFLVKRGRVLHQFVPVARWMEIDFDHPGIRCNLEVIEARIVRGRRAFNDD